MSETAREKATDKQWTERKLQGDIFKALFAEHRIWSVDDRIEVLGEVARLIDDDWQALRAIGFAIDAFKKARKEALS